MIYISYARDDHEHAKQLYTDLDNAGLNPWLDTKKILPGQHTDITIRKAIEESQYFLALISENSVKRGYVHKEMRIALDIFKEFVPNDIYIIPASLDGTRAVDIPVKALECVDLRDYQEGLARILNLFKIPVSKATSQTDSTPPVLPRQDNTNTAKLSEHLQQQDIPKYTWDDIFIGRGPQVEKLMNTWKDGFIFGARRIGKTSLLRYIEKQYAKQNILAFYISFQGVNPEKVKRKLGIAFRRKNFSVDEKLSWDHSFFDFLEELDIILTRPIVLLVDEAEEIQKFEKSEPGFMDKLRNLVESTEKIRFILAASPHFIRIASGTDCSCSAFLSAFDTHILPVMTRDETCELMRQFADTITDDETKQILSFTYYQPYLVRIFISKLLRDGRLRSPSKEYAMDAYNANALEGIFPNYFEGLDEDDQILVRQIHSRKFQPGDKYESRLRALVQYGYLKSESGEYRISNWFFQHWLDCEAGETNTDECQPESPVAVQTEENIKKSEKNNRETIPDFWTTATRFQLIYSLSGLFLGLICIIGGVFLFYNGAIGGASWTAKMLGPESTISDATPGVILFIVGLFMVFITRFVIKRRR
ncbi:MAG: toll/interleukin-1 receptor domain-containing protein [Desulfobacterales bacterium]|nr:toll/interleukin-1 receptor domain-containing protein [Desulfobacterales bacterium]